MIEPLTEEECSTVIRFCRQELEKAKYEFLDARETLELYRQLPVTEESIALCEKKTEMIAKIYLDIYHFETIVAGIPEEGRHDAGLIQKVRNLLVTIRNIEREKGKQS